MFPWGSTADLFKGDGDLTLPTPDGDVVVRAAHREIFGMLLGAVAIQIAFRPAPATADEIAALVFDAARAAPAYAEQLRVVGRAMSERN